MSFNVRGRQTGASCRKKYEPFMFGSSYGCGVSPSARSSGQRGPTNVRDCMQWGQGKSNNSNNFMSYAGTGDWQQQQPQYKDQGQQYYQPKAFLSGASGQGEGALPIPCRMAPLGTNPQTLLQPMEPVTLKVAPPFSSKPGNGPMTFTIDPSQIYGNVFRR